MTRHAVTGAFGFTGRHIAARLLADGHDVVTLTNHPARSGRPDPGAITVAPLVFDGPALTRSLQGVDTLFNTYWVRFAKGDISHDQAVGNSRTLIAAARAAGVRRVVHVSIANPDASSRLPYYRGKAEVEAELIGSGLSYAILRPAVLFGDEPILFNNIAWLLRRLPVFGVAGDGRYRIQPIHVDDLADLAVGLALQTDDVVTDAAGPEAFEFNELVTLIRSEVRAKSLIVHGPPALAVLAAGLLSRALGDVLLTRDELAALMSSRLVSHDPPAGTTSFTRWLAESSSWLGREYMSELKRNYATAADR